MSDNTTVAKTQGCQLILLMRQPSAHDASISIKALMAINIVPTMITIAANSVLLLTIAKTKSLHTPSNVLVGALCFSDLLVGAVSQPSNLAFLFEFELHHELYTTLSAVAKWSSIILNGMSFLIVLFITLDRYFAVCHPFFYQQRLTIKKCSIIVALSWIYQLSVPVLSGTYYFMLFAFVTILSFAVMFVCYIRIYSVIAEKERSVLRLGKIGDEEEQILSHNREDRSNVCTVVIILAVITLSYLPAVIVILVIFTPAQRTSFCNLTPSKYIMFVWSTAVFSLSSLINPIVYCIRIKPIKKATADIVFCRKNRVHPQ